MPCTKAIQRTTSAPLLFQILHYPCYSQLYLFFLLVASFIQFLTNSTDSTDQVVRTNGVDIDIGKLLYKTRAKEISVPSFRDSPTSIVMARWMVSIEGSSKSEEDISESMLGRVLEADGGAGAETNSIISSSSDSNIATTAPNIITKKTVTAVKVSQDRKHHSTNQNNQVVTAKRAPRTRSSAADPSELFGGIEEVALPPTKRSAARKNGTSPRLQAGETSVVKVPLLTGTLFLYRGLHRRAEFIRNK
jgi:hypothetical protein